MRAFKPSSPALLAIIAALTLPTAVFPNPDVARAAVERCVGQETDAANCIGVYATPCVERLRRPRYAVSAEAFFTAMGRYLTATDQCHWDEMAGWDRLALPEAPPPPPTACPGVRTKFLNSRDGLPDPFCLLEERARWALDQKN